MMSSVFGHGRLRLYLLKLLAEEPRHGYDVIRLLEDRFMGVYAPSAGTIYPRLARLEEEGLVEHEVAEGKKVYRLTDAGRAELADRQDELTALEQDIDTSVRELAREVREDVRSSVRGLREELKTAAREVRDAEHHRTTERKRSDAWSDSDGRSDVPGWAEAKEALREAQRAVRESTRSWQTEWHGDRRSKAADSSREAVKELLDTSEQVRAEARRAAKSGMDDDALREMRAVLQTALTHLRDLVGK